MLFGCAELAKIKSDLSQFKSQESPLRIIIISYGDGRCLGWEAVIEDSTDAKAQKTSKRHRLK